MCIESWRESTTVKDKELHIGNLAEEVKDHFLAKELQLTESFLFSLVLPLAKWFSNSSVINHINHILSPLCSSL